MTQIPFSPDLLSKGYKLIIAFLFLWLAGSSQDTVKLSKLSPEFWSFISFADSTRPKTDTAEVILLVTNEHWDDAAHAMKAYSVRKWDATEVYYPIGNQLSYQTQPIGWVHDHYLDKNKKPLPKNIIVWMQKP